VLELREQHRLRVIVKCHELFSACDASFLVP